MAIAPIKSGAGTNIKVLEALAYGCPIVNTKFATRGFENQLIHGYNCMIAEDEVDFARNVIQLMISPGLCSEIAEHGKKLIHDGFTAERFNEYFYKALNDAVKS